MRGTRAIWGALVLAACNTFDAPSDGAEPRNLLPTSTIATPVFPQPAPAGRGVFIPTSGTGAVGAAGRIAMPPVGWQPIDAGPPPSADADGGEDDAGSARPARP